MCLALSMDLRSVLACGLFGLLTSCAAQLTPPATKPTQVVAEAVADSNVQPVTPRIAHGQKPVAASGPAGIVLYCHHLGELHLLLANDRFGSRGWGGFVGGDKEGETAAMTAARETHEETRGYYDRMKLFRMIANQQPVKLWGCHWYFAEVAYVDAKKIMDHRIPLLNPAYMETQHYAWVPYREIQPLLEKKSLTVADLQLHPRHLQPNSRSKSYWRVWIDNMRQLHLKDAFPWGR